MNGKQVLVYVLIFALVIPVVSLNIPLVQAVNIFDSDFEEGDLSEWTSNATSGSGAVGVQSSIVHHGSYALNASRTADAGTAFVSKSLTLGLDSYGKFEFQASATPPLNTRWVIGRFTDGSLIGQVEWWNNGGTLTWQVFFRTNGANDIAASNTSVAIAANQWYTVEIRSLAHESAGGMELWVNGTNLISKLDQATSTSLVVNTFQVGLISTVGAGSARNFFVDCVAVNNAYIGVEVTGDTTAPTYSGLSSSSTLAGSSCRFNASFTDETALTTNGRYQFGINNNGSWVWDSAVNFTSMPQTVSVLKTLSSTIGQSVRYMWNFTDNAGNSNTTGIQTLTTTAAYITLQAKDKDGLNLPRAVTFSGTLPNGTAYSVTSNTAGLYSLQCSNGSLTVAVTWQSHAVKASSTIAVTANASSSLTTKIARLNFTTNYVLVSVNETTIGTPSYTVLGGWKIDNIAGSGQKGLVVDQANWVKTSNPLTIKIGGNSYESTNWALSSNILTFPAIDFVAYAEPTIELIYEVSSGDSSGSSGSSGSVPTASPSGNAPLGANDFQISNLELGTIQPNSTVTATLHLRYSGSSYTFKELYLSNPFYTWFIQDSVSLTTYVLTNPTESNADVTLTFQIPADVPIQNFEGEIRFTVLDAFGTSHTSSAVVSASVEGASEGFDFQVWFRANWWVAVFIVVAVFAVLGLVATKTRRH